MLTNQITRNLFLLGLLALIVFGFGQLDLHPAAASGVFPLDDFSAKIPPDTYQALKQKAADGQIRLIVHLNAAFSPQTMALNGQAAQNQQRGIRIAQAQVEQALSGSNSKVLINYKYIPFNVVAVDARALDILLSLPFVLGVEEDKLSSPQLADSIPLINADDAWASGYTGAGQVIAILDTGVDKNHPFLSGKVVSEACYSSNYDDNDGKAPDYSSTSICPGGVEQSTAAGSALPYIGTCPSGECDHGTHVAGIASGKGGSFSGVAKDADIIAIQVFSRFDDYCNPACALSWSSDQTRGLERVYELALQGTLNIAAVNMSIGGGNHSDYCDQYWNGEAWVDTDRKVAIDLLRSVGIATVISSGNNGYTNGISAPACISSAVSVGATTKSNDVAYYSNSVSFLKLLAPGGVPSGAIQSSLPYNNYGLMYGTSMAAPHVTGAWAVIKSKYPLASVDDVLITLQNTGVPIFDTRNSLTKPRIDLMSSLDLYLGTPLNTTATAALSDDNVNLTWTDNNENEDGFRIERRVPAGVWTEIGTAAANEESYLDNTAACETTFEYRVVAYNTSGDSNASNTASDTTTICAPSGLVLTTTQQRITLDWTDNSASETGYRVERSPDGSSGWTQLGGDLPENTQSFFEYPLACGSPTYYYRVTVYNATASRTSVVVEGATQPCTPPPLAPTNPSARPLSISSIEVVWDDVGDYETGYRIDRSPDGSNNWAIVGTVEQDETAFIDQNLETAEDYFYRISATNPPHGSSPYSSVVSAATYPISAHLPLIMQ